jgi:hypothetical protein
MKIRAARAAAINWVNQYASREPWFRGAYFSGSTVGRRDNEDLRIGSDVDVVVVTKEDHPPPKLGKFLYNHVLLEVTYLPWNQLMHAEEVLETYHLAGSFQVDTIIMDRTGDLHTLQKVVSSCFADLKWVSKRCLNAMQRIENGLKEIKASDPWHDQVTAWLFPTGVTTHVVLVAALCNPTVRLRYLSAREVLFQYKQEQFYSELLGLLGCEQMDSRCVERHLNALVPTFNAAMEAAKTSFFFSSDITEVAKPIAIEGSRELILNGYHREAVFWIVATFARCHKILAADAPLSIQRELAPAFHSVLADLGIGCTEDLFQRSKDVIRILPRLWEAAEAIMNTRNSFT